MQKMRARDLRPISIVEGDRFNEFSNELNAAYCVPGRHTVAKHVELMYLDERNVWTIADY